MFLDENSFALIHKLVLKLKNLLSLVHLVKKQRSNQGQFGVLWSYLDSLFSLFDICAKSPVKYALFKVRFVMFLKHVSYAHQRVDRNDILGSFAIVKKVCRYVEYLVL